ncbi:MAG: hypothetical protein Q8Q60_00105 [Candidatus Chromulinivorax sp.]|nr:hypothetical protein [Candidatus Chromulinivorax sp.]
MNFENINDENNHKLVAESNVQSQAPNLNIDKIAASAELLIFFYWRNLSDHDYVVLLKHSGNTELEPFDNSYDFNAGGRSFFATTTGKIIIYHGHQQLSLELIGDKTDYYLWINEDGSMEYFFENQYKNIK